VRIRLLCLALALGLALRSATSPGGEHCPPRWFTSILPSACGENQHEYHLLPCMARSCAKDCR